MAIGRLGLLDPALHQRQFARRLVFAGAQFGQFRFAARHLFAQLLDDFLARCGHLVALASDLLEIFAQFAELAFDLIEFAGRLRLFAFDTAQRSAIEIEILAQTLGAFGETLDQFTAGAGERGGGLRAQRNRRIVGSFGERLFESAARGGGGGVIPDRLGEVGQRFDQRLVGSRGVAGALTQFAQFAIGGSRLAADRFEIQIAIGDLFTQLLDDFLAGFRHLGAIGDDLVVLGPQALQFALRRLRLAHGVVLLASQARDLLFESLGPSTAIATGFVDLRLQLLVVGGEGLLAFDQLAHRQLAVRRQLVRIESGVVEGERQIGGGLGEGVIALCGADQFFGQFAFAATEFVGARARTVDFAAQLVELVVQFGVLTRQLIEFGTCGLETFLAAMGVLLERFDHGPGGGGDLLAGFALFERAIEIVHLGRAGRERSGGVRRPIVHREGELAQIAQLRAERAFLRARRGERGFQFREARFGGIRFRLGLLDLLATGVALGAHLVVQRFRQLPGGLRLRVRSRVLALESPFEIHQ